MGESAMNESAMNESAMNESAMNESVDDASEPSNEGCNAAGATRLSFLGLLGFAAMTRRGPE